MQGTSSNLTKFDRKKNKASISFSETGNGICQLVPLKRLIILIPTKIRPNEKCQNQFIIMK